MYNNNNNSNNINNNIKTDMMLYPKGARPNTPYSGLYLARRHPTSSYSIPRASK